jgi:Tfp pilus assembly protein PilF
MTLLCSLALLAALMVGFTHPEPGDQMGMVEMSISHGRYADALELLDHLVAADPGRVEAYTRRAFVNLKLNRTSQAIADFSRVIELSPQDSVAYISRGFLHDQQHQQELAAADFRQACQLGDQGGCRLHEEIRAKKSGQQY